MISKSSRIQAGLWSSILGDALGVPVEFQSREEIAKNPVIGFRSHGTYDLPEGYWSDDSSLMLCSMENLTEGGDFEALMAKFKKWLNEGYMTPGGFTFDCGIATREAIGRFSQGEQALLCGSMDEYSNGNGSLMRILPFAYRLADSDPDTRRKRIFDASRITHGHSRSKLACWLYSEVIRNLMEGLGKAESVDLAHSIVEEWVQQNGAMNEWGHFARCTSRIVDLPVSSIKSSGYVIDTLEASLYSFLKHDDIWSSLLFSVNLGSDTDTVACVTGGLAGTFYGIDAVDPGWIKRLAKWEEIDGLIGTFAT